MADSVATVMNISYVPAPGTTIWFVSQDEFTEGMEISGVVTSVSLTHIKVDVTNGGGVEGWTIPLNEPNSPFFSSREDLLDDLSFKLHQENLRLTRENQYYRARYGPFPE